VHPASQTEEELLKKCSIKNDRSGGPGGQHRNKVETAVIITHLPTNIKGQATEARQQAQNKKKALFRLRINLALEIRTSPEKSPSALWNKRLKGGRILINQEHTDFPALLAEVLDTLYLNENHLKKSAEYLGCSASQLTKFLKKETKAFEKINKEREKLGLRKLR
jgi:hypothetical protein